MARKTLDRDCAMFERWLEGETYAQISRDVGLSSTQVRQCCEYIARRFCRPPWWACNDRTVVRAYCFGYGY